MRARLKKWGRKLRYEPQYFRQQIGGLFALLLVIFSAPSGWEFWIGAPVVLLGTITRLWAAGHLKKDDELGTHGPYAFMRHPQYFGNTCIGIGLSVACGHPWAIAIFGVIFYIFYLPAIREEDQKLREKFGAVCEEWQEKVPAVIPTPFPADNPGLHLSDWSGWQALRNGEPAWTAGLLLSLGLVFSRIPEAAQVALVLQETITA
jgi:protein-S-isoprenylcysteine O-methyltransferase Ste14